MMHSFTPALQEFCYGTVLAHGLKQFDFGFTEREKGRAYLLQRDFFNLFAMQSQGLFIKNTGLGYGMDSYAYMINFFQHIQRPFRGGRGVLPPLFVL
jgi:hypothetical protein